MRFYHCFYTDLPDEFVEANASELSYLASSFVGAASIACVDGVGLDCRSRGHTPDYSTITAVQWSPVHNWMQLNKGKYSGGYWKSLAPDQRDPNRATRYTGRTSAYYSPPGAISQGPGYPYQIPGPSLISPLMQAGLPSYASQLASSLYPWDRPPSRPALKREIKMGEITGYRCWRIENGLLRSVYQRDIWYPGKILEGRELEDWGQRGVHSWKQPNSRQFLEYLMGYLAYVADPAQSHLMSINGNGSRMVVSNTALVTGSVILWGDVVEHEYGYRGEFAKVKSLDWLYPSQDMMGRERSVLDNLRTEYGV
jgi:hypothetical protein